MITSPDLNRELDEKMLQNAKLKLNKGLFLAFKCVAIHKWVTQATGIWVFSKISMLYWWYLKLLPALAFEYLTFFCSHRLRPFLFSFLLQENGLELIHGCSYSLLPELKYKKCLWSQLLDLSLWYFIILITQPFTHTLFASISDQRAPVSHVNKRPACLTNSI